MFVDFRTSLVLARVRRMGSCDSTDRVDAERADVVTLKAGCPVRRPGFLAGGRVSLDHLTILI